MKKLIILILLLPFTTQAITLLPLPEPQPNIFERCGFNIFCYFKTQLGSISLTNITGSTQVSAYPTIQNANNLALTTEINNMIASTTNTSLVTANNLTSASSLATLGTVTSGTWSATTIAANKGGTGQSSYSTGDIVYASGASTLSKLSISSDGKVLQLSGGLPTWQSISVDQTLTYAWTGVHNFTGSATYIKNLTASSTIIFDNGGSPLTWITPTSHTPLSSPLTSSSNGFLQNNGSGTLTWAAISQAIGTSSTPTTITTTTASTTLFSFTVPANTLSTGNSIALDIPLSSFAVENAANMWFDLAYGTGSTTQAVSGLTNFTGQVGVMRVILQGAGATGSQKATIAFTGMPIGTFSGANAIGVSFVKTGTLSQDSTVAKTFMLVVRFGTGNSADNITADQIIGRINR